MYKKWICFFILVIGLGTFFIFTGCQQDQIRLAEEDVQVKVATYNVLFGNWCNPKRVGEALKPYNFDIIGFTEVPGGSWTSEVGEVLGTEYSYVGTISSANHVDKYKSILSKTPLENTREYQTVVDAPYIWSPSSMVGAETVVRGVRLVVYALHVPGVDQASGSACDFIVNNILPLESNPNLIIMGDYNNLLGNVAFAPYESAGMQSNWQDLDIDVNNESTHRNIQTNIESGVIDHLFYNSDSSAKAVDGGIVELFNPSDEDKEMPIYKEEWTEWGKPLSDHRLVWTTFEFSSK